MGVYAGDTVPYLTETFNVAPDVQRYIGNALVRDNDDVKPTLDLDFANNKSLTDDVSGDNLITFTRTTVGTYVDSEGIIRTSGGNICTFSEDFTGTDWAWQGTSGTITSGFSSPAGDLTASKLITSSNTSGRRKDLAPKGVSGVTNSFVSFNLLNGEYISTIVGSPTYGSESVSNGWYRYWITANGYTYSIYAKSAEYTQIQLQALNQFFYVYAPEAVGGNTTDGILIWGAQVEEGPTPSQYLKTTTAPNYFPRYDHDPVTLESLGLLIEEERTNQFDNSVFGSGWITINISKKSTNNPAPDGSNTAVLIGDSTAGGTTSYLQKSLDATGQGIQTFTFYAKRTTTGQSAFIDYYDAGANRARANINLDDGSITYIQQIGDAAISSVHVGNNWWRVQLTLTPVGTGLFDWRAGNSASGDIYIWGAQVERGSFATSYIPTTTSQVIRGPDIATITGTNFSSWFNQNEGTFYGNAKHSLSQSYPRILSADNGFNDQIAIVFFDDTSQGLGFFVFDDPVEQLRLVSNTQTTSFQQLAGYYALNNFAASIDGGNTLTSLSGVIPTTTQLSIGNRGAGDRNLNGTIKKIVYYPTRLSNATLQELTQDNPTNLPATIIPPIVTDGLVFNLDAGTPSSYSGTGTTWFDKTDNNNDGTLINMDGTNFNSSNGGSLTFDGSNEFIQFGTPGLDVDPSINISGLNITLSAWIKATELVNLSSGGGIIVRGSGVNDGLYEMLLVQSGGKNYPYFRMLNVGTYFPQLIPIELNQYYNIVCVYDNGTLRNYVNGVQEGSGLVSNLPINTNTSFGTTINIGRRLSDGSSFFPGNIAQASVYNKALSPAEVKQNYQALLPRFAVTDGLILNLDAGNRKSYPATGTTWTDLTGNGNDGTLTNGPTFDSSNGGSIAFDGSNQYSSIGVSDFLTGITDFSLELWFNFDTLTNGIFYTLFSYGGYVPNGFLFQREGTNNVLRYAYNGLTLFDTVDTFTSVNEWNHAIVTIINGIPQKIYLNGVEKTTNTVTSPLSINSPKTVEIGRRTDTSSQYFDGKIAQVKIYNRALSQEEVQQNFNVTRGRFGV